MSYVVFVLIFFLVDESLPFHMKPDYALSTAAKLLGLSWPFYLVTTLSAGWIFVRFGRRLPIFCGYLVSLSGAVIMSCLARTVWPGVYLCLVMIQLGAAIC